ncbi:MAG: hypothetical protein OXC84_01045 [Gammaproteobacteria bacterium]|nr:hypothetical protein [Gammaproteobacteria bacterium]
MNFTIKAGCIPLTKSLSSMIFLLSLGLWTTALAETLGPRVPEADANRSSPAATAKKNLPTRMDIPPLKVAVPVLGTGVDEFSDKLEKEGIWPGLRKTETIRSATKIRDALLDLNQFESVVVFPDTSISADLYVLGSIRESTGEIMSIEWQLVDATGKIWIRKNKETHRVPPGWHERFGGQGIDPFQKLYRKIAYSVYKELKKFARKHDTVVKQNRKRAREGKSPKLSELDRIVAIRELVLAQYFAPEIYGDAIAEKKSSKAGSRLKGSRLTLQYLPDKSAQEWTRIESFRQRDETFTLLMNDYYNTFRAKVDPSYELWLKDIYPIARETRILRSKANVEKALGVVTLIAAASAAKDADSTGKRDRAIAVGAAVGGTLLIKGFADSARSKKQLEIFNETARSYHDSFNPISVELAGKTITLQGTAQEQFAQWRNLLRDFYEREDSEIEEVQIIRE